MKAFERVLVLKRKMRNLISLDDMQFGLRPGRGTTDEIFIVRQIQEKFLAQKKDLWMAFVDLKKALRQSSSRRGVVGLETVRS